MGCGVGAVGGVLWRRRRLLLLCELLLVLLLLLLKMLLMLFKLLLLLLLNVRRRQLLVDGVTSGRLRRLQVRLRYMYSGRWVSHRAKGERRDVCGRL